MSTRRPQDLNRDLGPWLDEPLERVWKTTKKKYEGSTNKSFIEIINELMIIKRKDKLNELHYNDRNVELLVQAGRIAPHQTNIRIQNWKPYSHTRKGWR